MRSRAGATLAAAIRVCRRRPSRPARCHSQSGSPDPRRGFRHHDQAGRRRPGRRHAEAVDQLTPGPRGLDAGDQLLEDRGDQGLHDQSGTGHPHAGVVGGRSATTVVVRDEGVGVVAYAAAGPVRRRAASRRRGPSCGRPPRPRPRQDATCLVRPGCGRPATNDRWRRPAGSDRWNRAAMVPRSARGRARSRAPRPARHPRRRDRRARCHVQQCVLIRRLLRLPQARPRTLAPARPSLPDPPRARELMPTKKMDAKRAAKARRLEQEAAKRKAHAAERRRSWLVAGSALGVGVLLVLLVEIPRWTAPTPIARRVRFRPSASRRPRPPAAPTRAQGPAQGRPSPPPTRPESPPRSSTRTCRRPPASPTPLARRQRRTTTRAGEGPTPRRWCATCRTATPSLWYTASLPKNQADQLTYVGDKGAVVALSGSSS